LLHTELVPKMSSLGSCCSSINIMNRLQSEHSILIPGRDGDFSNRHRVQTGSGSGAQSPIELVLRFLSLGIKLITTSN